jgi:hypothetical protein
MHTIFINSKSETVSSITILGACQLLGKTLMNALDEIHLPPFNSVKV